MEINDRVRLQYMGADPDPIPVGTEGTIRFINRVNLSPEPFTQVIVDWDNGRTLMCVMPPDRLTVIAPATTATATPPETAQ